VPQTHDRAAVIAGEVLLLIVSCLRQHREKNRTLRPHARQATGSMCDGRTEQECRNREQRQSAA
jgi:hypothetical protein